jgi:hypothetical protein
MSGVSDETCLAMSDLSMIVLSRMMIAQAGDVPAHGKAPE